MNTKDSDRNADSLKGLRKKRNILLAVAIPLSIIVNSVITPLMFTKETPPLNRAIEAYTIAAPEQLDFDTNEPYSRILNLLKPRPQTMALKVLQYSHLHVAAAMDYTFTPELDIETSLSEGIGDCQEASLLTYLCFLDYAKKHNSEIAQYVRLAKGVYDDGTVLGKLTGKAHSWLEFNIDGKWQIYDPTILLNEIDEVESWLFKEIDGDKVNQSSYRRFMTYQVNPNGNLIDEKQLLSALGYMPGALGLSLESFLENYVLG